MLRSSQRTFFVLLCVVLVALFTGFFLKGMIAKDFENYVERERAALVRLIASDMEESYRVNGKWDRMAAAGISIRALELGSRVRLLDSHGDIVMDTDQALAMLASDKASRIRAAAGFDFNGEHSGIDYRSYPLVIEKENAGSLDMKFLKEGRSDAFSSRSGIIVMSGVLLPALLALALVMIFSRKQLRQETIAAQAASDNHIILNTETPAAITLETIPVPEPVKEIVSEAESPVSITVDVQEDQKIIPDEPLDEPDEDDADDLDMQPLPGDPDRITKIVKGLDGLAKAQALRSALQKQHLELSPYLANLIENARESIPGTDVTFNLECSDNLSIFADPESLTGIMANLLDNAAKAVKHSGTVTVKASEQGESIQFIVSDTGVGIRRNALPHIFERFYRGSGDGIGLGLTIVKELVDACEGVITVESKRGRGSVFSVCIPRS